MPDLTDDLRAFWRTESLAQAMHERVTVPPQPAAWNDAHQGQALSALLGGIVVNSSDNILDYGCGVGRVSRALLLAGAKVTAADVSPQMLGFAQEYCAGLPGLTTCLSDGFGCQDVADASMQGAISVYCLQHMPTLTMVESVMRDIYRIVAAGGWFILQSTDHGVELKDLPVGFLGARQKLCTMLQLADSIGFVIDRVVYPLNADEAARQYIVGLRK